MEKWKWNCGQLWRDSSTWDYASLSFERDRAYGFSWPQRNYSCSFCNKEFKSAQALGGHMNVHRRDRARMRLSPSWDPPNPNPNFPLSSSPPKFSPYNMPFHSPLAAAAAAPNAASLQHDNVPAAADPHDILAICRGDKENKSKGPMLEVTSFARRKEARVFKASEFVRLDLNLGLIQDVEEDLDLELRLGYS